MQHLSYYAKAYANAVYAGLIYLMANIAPTASHLSDIPLIVWIGFAAAIFGSFGLTAIVTNGPKPVKETPAPKDDSPTASSVPDPAVASQAPVEAQPPTVTV
jgi:hypothetical protein